MSNWIEQSCKPEWTYYMKHCIGVRLAESGVSCWYLIVGICVVFIALLFVAAVIDRIKE